MTEEELREIDGFVADGMFHEAYALALPHAKAGDALAQGLVGIYFCGGFLAGGDAVNGESGRALYVQRLHAHRKRGVEWLRKASAAGNGIATINLGTEYLSGGLDGLSAEESRAKAKELYALAREQGAWYTDID